MSVKRLFTSCFGLGFLPVAPGTWGSLPPAIIFGLMCYFGISALLISIVMACMVIFGFFVCVKFAPSVVAATGKADPHEVVADELAGQAVTFLFIISAVPTEKTWIVALAGFLFFRLFDIVKPWPIRKLEKLPKGWGILADDLLAGVYALIVLNIFVWFWIIVPAAQC